MTPDSADRIVELMLGEVVANISRRGSESRAAQRDGERPRVEVRNLAADTRLRDVSFELYSGEVLGVVALEGQGQDELFDILAGSDRPLSGEVLVDGKSVSFRHPADAIREGVVFVPADRAEALLMQRSVRDNIALPFSVRMRKWGPISARKEKPHIDNAIERLQIETRAQREVGFLSGGNQQKVTIARWLATGVKTMLCFDPTRGIDIRTKHQLYPLLRELATAGAAILLYTSDLSEIQLVCDRAIVIFAGEVVTEVDAADADEATLLRAAHNLSSDSLLPEEAVVAVQTEGGAQKDVGGMEQ